jgi:hypothetical protein
VPENVRVNVFGDTRPDTCLFHHGPEIAGLERLSVLANKHKIVSVYSPAKIFSDKFKIIVFELEHMVFAVFDLEDYLWR